MSNWLFLVVLGVVSAVAGLLALFNPFPASLAVLQFVGIAFLIIGAGQVFEAFRAEGWGGKIWSLLLGVIAVLVGINLLARPLEGLITLSFVLAAMFIASGIFKLVVGWRIHMLQLRYAVLISGLASLLIGLIIFANFPASAATSLGILLGVELLSNGISAIAMGYSRKTGGVLARA
jgi:membrane protein HdeD